MNSDQTRDIPSVPVQVTPTPAVAKQHDILTSVLSISQNFTDEIHVAPGEVAWVTEHLFGFFFDDLKYALKTKSVSNPERTVDLIVFLPAHAWSPDEMHKAFAATPMENDEDLQLRAKRALYKKCWQVALDWQGAPPIVPSVFGSIKAEVWYVEFASDGCAS